MGSPVTAAWLENRAKKKLPGLRPQSARQARKGHRDISHGKREVYVPKRPPFEMSPARKGGKTMLPSNSGPLQIPPYIPGYAAFDMLMQYRDARRDFLHSARNRTPVWSPPHRGRSAGPRSSPRTARPQSARPFRPHEGIFKPVHFKSLEKLNKAK